MPLAFLNDFLGSPGTCKLYIVARSPTNSFGATESVSLLNLPSTRVVRRILGKTRVEIAGVQLIQHLPEILVQIASPDLATERVCVGEQQRAYILLSKLRSKTGT